MSNVPKTRSHLPRPFPTHPAAGAKEGLESRNASTRRIRISQPHFPSRFVRRSSQRGLSAVMATSIALEWLPHEHCSTLLVHRQASRQAVKD